MLINSQYYILFLLGAAGLTWLLWFLLFINNMSSLKVLFKIRNKITLNEVFFIILSRSFFLVFILLEFIRYKMNVRLLEVYNGLDADVISTYTNQDIFYLFLGGCVFYASLMLVTILIKLSNKQTKIAIYKKKITAHGSVYRIKKIKSYHWKENLLVLVIKMTKDKTKVVDIEIPEEQKKNVDMQLISLIRSV